MKIKTCVIYSKFDREVKRMKFFLIYKVIYSLFCFYLRRKIKNKSFTLIGNSCFVAKIYQMLNVPYFTVTVASTPLYDDYIKFVYNIRYYLEQELVFIENSKFDIINERMIKNHEFYPIAMLGDIEWHFIHEKSKDVALEKWNKRKKRINMDNLFFYMDDRDGLLYETIKKFDALPYPKVFMSANKYPEIKSWVYIPEAVGNRQAYDFTNRWWIAFKHFDFVSWLNDVRSDKK